MSMLVPKLWPYHHVGWRYVLFSGPLIFFPFVVLYPDTPNSHTIIAENAAKEVKKLKKKVTKLESTKAKLVEAVQDANVASTNAIKVRDIGTHMTRHTPFALATAPAIPLTP